MSWGTLAGLMGDRPRRSEPRAWASRDRGDGANRGSFAGGAAATRGERRWDSIDSRRDSEVVNRFSLRRDEAPDSRDLRGDLRLHLTAQSGSRPETIGLDRVLLAPRERSSPGLLPVPLTALATVEFLLAQSLKLSLPRAHPGYLCLARVSESSTRNRWRIMLSLSQSYGLRPSIGPSPTCNSSGLPCNEPEKLGLSDAPASVFPCCVCKTSLPYLGEWLQPEKEGGLDISLRGIGRMCPIVQPRGQKFPRQQENISYLSYYI